MLKVVRGEYIALCEGDDFWISETKLQTQYTAMRRAGVDLSFHPVKHGRNNNNEDVRVICKYFDSASIISAGAVIENGGGFMPTASLIVSRAVFEQLPESLVQKSAAGDYLLQVFGSFQRALYLPIVASFYRAGVSGSWTSSQRDPS